MPAISAPKYNAFYKGFEEFVNLGYAKEATFELERIQDAQREIGIGLNGLVALNQNTDPYTRMNLGIDGRLQSLTQILQGLQVKQTAVSTNLQ